MTLSRDVEIGVLGETRAFWIIRTLPVVFECIGDSSVLSSLKMGPEPLLGAGTGDESAIAPSTFASSFMAAILASLLLSSEFPWRFTGVSKM